MGATYTRQSSSGIVDGGVIEASDLNNEFDQLLAAFVAASGHTHDGTAAEGGPITKLLGTAITIGDGTSGTDIAVTFDGESADGVLTWMEDEDYFKFSDDILVNSTEKLMFQDTGTYVYSNADGDLDIVSDGTAVDSINLESAGGITLDAGTAGSGIIYEDDGTAMLSIINSSSDVILTTKVQDKDFIIKGDDGGSAITALTLDMSEAGAATFNNKVVATELDISGNMDIDGTSNLDIVDIDGAVQVDNTITVGADDQGYDVKFFGDTASAYMLWDTSADDLVLAGAAGIDLAGDIDVDGTANLDAVDIDGAVQIDGAVTVGVDGTGLDVKFFGDTSGSFLLWDQSDDALELTDSSPIKIGDGGDMQIYHDGTNSYITNSEGALKVATETSGIAVTIGHTTSETTIADNLTVTGNLSIGGNFDVTGTIDLSDSDFTNAGDIQLDSITGDGDTNTSITFSGSDVITVTTGGETQITFNNGSILPTTDNDVDLGSSSYQFKDAYINGTLEADAITIGGTAIGSIYGVVAGSSSIVTTGALDSGSITSGFGAIDNGTSGIRTNTFTAETAFVPDASGGADLGTATLEFNDAFFNDSSVINFGDDQDITLTHVADTGLTLAGSHANGTNLQLNNTATDGDSAIQFALSGTVAYTMGVEDGDSDKFVINYGTGALGAQPALEISSAGAVTVPGDLTVSGTLTGAASAGFALAMAVAL